MSSVFDSPKCINMHLVGCFAQDLAEGAYSARPGHFA